jgi:hypothetical protein
VHVDRCHNSVYVGVYRSSSVSIRIASLDDPSRVQPSVDIWTVSAQPWESLDRARSEVETQPTTEQLEDLFAPHG